MSANRFISDRDGSILVELSLVLPLILFVALGTIDMSYMLYDWESANKAAYAGARAAIVSAPVATGITSPAWNGALIGESCIDATTGLPNKDGAGADFCPSVSTVCTPNGSNSGSCTDGSAFDNLAFCRIFTGDPTCPATAVSGSMKSVFPRLQRQNIQIAYQTSGLGFVGRPDGLPMNVTVSIRCMTHDFYFVTPFVAYFTGRLWTFGALPNDCPDTTAAPSMPSFATTLPSEDMVTN